MHTYDLDETRRLRPATIRAKCLADLPKGVTGGKRIAAIWMFDLARAAEQKGITWLIHIGQAQTDRNLAREQLTCVLLDLLELVPVRMPTKSCRAQHE